MRAEAVTLLDYWIKERSSILLRKTAGMPKPWSDDPIFQQYKFCNVKREDDYVTKWFASNWRHKQYWDDTNFIPAMILGRTINWPPTLEAVGFPSPWVHDKILSTLNRLTVSGVKVYTGAYMITAGPPGVRKNDWIMGNSTSYMRNPPQLDPASIQRSWETIMANKYPCVGPFIAGQVIADLKHTKHLSNAKDWSTWAALGPGSMRGVNRIYGRRVGTNLTQSQGLREMLAIKNELQLTICLQDVQNCLCEFDKYMRVRLGEGKPRSHYNGVN